MRPKDDMRAAGPPHLSAKDLQDVDDLSAEAFRAFWRVLLLHRRIFMRVFARYGLHPGQGMCLRMLSGARDVTQRDLARALHVSPPTVTKMVGSMERAGLVSRRSDADDARLVRVEITETGRAHERLMHAATGEYARRTFGTLGEKERRDLARLLKKLGDRIELFADEADAAPAEGPAAGAANKVAR